jgi:hypothetical protein
LAKDASLLPIRHRFEPPRERPGPSLSPYSLQGVEGEFCELQFCELRMYGVLRSSPHVSNAQATAKIRYLGDVLERTSLIRCLLIQAGRGLEPHLGKSGHLGGVGSQWCNRLYRVEPPIIRGGKGRDRRALFASYLTYALPKTLRPTKATEERS